VSFRKARFSSVVRTNDWVEALTGVCCWIHSRVRKYQALSFTIGPLSDRKGM
jgi:hypothetical protein